MSKEHERIKELSIIDEMLFPDAKHLTGEVERQSKEGFVVRATKAGKAVRYSATDSDGKTLEGKYLNVSDGGPHPLVADQCFYCVNYQGSWYCTEVLCPEPA
jgi:hypothetical protein